MPKDPVAKKSKKGGKATSDSSRTPEQGAAVLATLRKPLDDLLGWLEGSRIPHVLIGGIAVGLLARPRTTIDIDAIIWVDEGNWKALVAEAARHGFSPREKHPIEFIRQTRMLLLHHDESGVDVDLSLGALPFERAAIDHRQTVQIENLVLPVPTAEDLIVMKAVAHRPQDLADIDSIVKAHPSLDVVAIETLVRAFAEVLEQPELVEDLLRILSAARRRPASSPKR